MRYIALPNIFPKKPFWMLHNINTKPTVIQTIGCNNKCVKIPSPVILTLIKLVKLSNHNIIEHKFLSKFQTPLIPVVRNNKKQSTKNPNMRFIIFPPCL